jgi:hypothetical protein
MKSIRDHVENNKKGILLDNFPEFGRIFITGVIIGKPSTTRFLDRGSAVDWS